MQPLHDADVGPSSPMEPVLAAVEVAQWAPQRQKRGRGGGTERVAAAAAAGARQAQMRAETALLGAESTALLLRAAGGGGGRSSLDGGSCPTTSNLPSKRGCHECAGGGSGSILDVNCSGYGRAGVWEAGRGRQGET